MRRTMVAVLGAVVLAMTSAWPAGASGPRSAISIAPSTGAIYLYDGSVSGNGPELPAANVTATVRNCPPLGVQLNATLVQDGFSMQWATTANGAGDIQCQNLADAKRFTTGMPFTGETLHSGPATAHFWLVDQATGDTIAEDTRTVRIP